MLRESPQDPRHGQIRLGEIPRLTALEEGLVRVIAPNASPMTLDGTNTYLVYGRDRRCYIVDPGPSVAEHLAKVLEVVESKRLTPRGIVLTHHHIDHSEAAHSWAALFETPIFAAVLDDPGRDAVVLGEGDAIDIDGQRLTARLTPGHTADHLCFVLPSGRVLTGDHVLGRGTSVVAHPDGDLQDYISSLVKLNALGPKAIYPGHGPDLDESSVGAVLDYYISHRLYRIQQVAAAFGESPTSIGDVVGAVYGQGIDPALFFAAELSTRAAIALLVKRGYLQDAGSGDSFVRTGSSIEELLQGVMTMSRQRRD